MARMASGMASCTKVQATGNERRMLLPASRQPSAALCNTAHKGLLPYVSSAQYILQHGSDHALDGDLNLLSRHAA